MRISSPREKFCFRWRFLLLFERWVSGFHHPSWSSRPSSIFLTSINTCHSILVALAQIILFLQILKISNFTWEFYYERNWKKLGILNLFFQIVSLKLINYSANICCSCSCCMIFTYPKPQTWKWDLKSERPLIAKPVDKSDNLANGQHWETIP